jgi:hypothetical protein
MSSRHRRIRSLIMFTVEHESDFTIVTTLDQSASFADVEVIFDAEDVVIRQYNEDMECYDLINLSYQQFKDIYASMTKTAGAYYAE